MSLLRDIGEDPLIERLLRSSPTGTYPAGPGDDCAVIDSGGDRMQLLKTDAIISGVHFLPEAPPDQIGWKAVARVASDFAAMGGRAEQWLITLATPADTEVAWLEQLYQGIGHCIRQCGGVIAGGETCSVPDGSATMISIAGTGVVERPHLTLRSTAAVGQSLLVTGTLGGSISGKHLNFTPRVEEAAWLVSHFKPSAMMDISDGLAKDLPRLASLSGCGFQLNRETIPCTQGCTIQQALADGEDYELLFAIEPDRCAALIDAWKRQFPELPLTAIGTLCDPGSGDAMEGGWDHFSARAD